MKRNWAALLVLGALAISANAQEFEVFGISLESVSATYMDAQTPQNPKSRKYIGFRGSTNTHGKMIAQAVGDLEIELGMYGQVYDDSGRPFDAFTRRDLGKKFKLPEYNVLNGYTDAQMNMYNRWVDVVNFRTAADEMSSLRLRKLNDEATNNALDAYRAQRLPAYGFWFECNRAPRYGATCPEGLAKTNVGRIWVLRPTGILSDTATLRVSIDLERNNQIDAKQAGAAIKKQYPNARSRTFKHSDGDWTVLYGQDEVLGTNGKRFFIQVSPERFTSLVTAQSISEKQKLIETFDYLQELGRQAVQQSETSKVGAIFGDNE